jgi:hypothetical protein
MEVQTLKKILPIVRADRGSHPRDARPPSPFLSAKDKLVRGFMDSLFEGQSHLQCLSIGKKTSEGDHFSSGCGGSKLDEKFSQHSRGRWTPVRISTCQRKMVRAFFFFFFAMKCWLEYPVNKKTL